MRPTVLVVDDEPDVRLMLRLKLDLEGFDVSEAAGGAAALAVLAETSPDLVLLDLRMADVDGWTVLEALQDQGRLPGLKVVTLSAHASPGTAERAAALGVRAHITKPVELAELVNAIRRVLAA